MTVTNEDIMIAVEELQAKLLDILQPRNPNKALVCENCLEPVWSSEAVLWKTEPALRWLCPVCAVGRVHNV